MDEGAVLPGDELRLMDQLLGFPCSLQLDISAPSLSCAALAGGDGGGGRQRAPAVASTSSLDEVEEEALAYPGAPFAGRRGLPSPPTTATATTVLASGEEAPLASLSPRATPVPTTTPPLSAVSSTSDRDGPDGSEEEGDELELDPELPEDWEVSPPGGRRGGRQTYRRRPRPEPTRVLPRGASAASIEAVLRSRVMDLQRENGRLVEALAAAQAAADAAAADEADARAAAAAATSAAAAAAAAASDLPGAPTSSSGCARCARRRARAAGRRDALAPAVRDVAAATAVRVGAVGKGAGRALPIPVPTVTASEARAVEVAAAAEAGSSASSAPLSPAVAVTKALWSLGEARLPGLGGAGPFGPPPPRVNEW